MDLKQLNSTSQNGTGQENQLYIKKIPHIRCRAILSLNNGSNESDLQLGWMKFGLIPN